MSDDSGGLFGFCGLLLVIFVVLKVVGAISWAWGWVLLPLWILPALALGLVAVVLAFALACIAVVVAFAIVALPFIIIFGDK